MDIDMMTTGGLPSQQPPADAPDMPAPPLVPSHEGGEQQQPMMPAPEAGSAASPTIDTSITGSDTVVAPPPDTGTDAAPPIPKGLSPEAAELIRQYDAGQATLVMPDAEAQGESAGGLAVDVRADDQEGEKVLVDLLDMGKSLVNAPYAAANELMDLSYSTGRFVYDVFDKGWKDAKFGEHKAPVRFADYEPISIAGDITKGIGQWASGMLMTGGVAKAGGLAANFLTRDVVASTVFFDRQQGLIANMVENIPELANPVTAMFATDKDDSVPEAMLKMAVESLGIGKAADMLVAGIKAVKWGGRASRTGSKEALENYDKAVADLTKAETEYRASDGETVKMTEGASPSISPATQEVVPLSPPDAPAPRRAIPTAGSDLLSDRSVLELAKKAEKSERPFSDIDPAHYELAYLKNVVVEHPQFLKDISDANAKNTFKSKVGSRSLDDVARETADSLREKGFSVDAVYQEGRRTKAAMEQFIQSALKVEAYIANTTDVVMDLATRINRGTASQRDKASFIMLAKNLQEFCILNADMGNVTGRALNARKLKLTPEKAKELLGNGADLHVDADGIATKPSFESVGTMTEQEASLWLGNSGVSEKALMQNVRDFLCSDTVAARQKTLLQTKPGVDPLRAFLEVRINGMLSGIPTHLVNVISTGFNVGLLRPLEKTVGGTLQGLFTGDFQHAKEGLALWKGTLCSFTDALRMSGKALKLGDNILDASASQLDMGTKHQLSYERLKNSLLRSQGKGSNEALSPMQETLCRAFGHIGTAIRLPTRLLMAEDELFKQLAFRGQLQADLAMEAAERGFSGKEAQAYIQGRMKDAFHADGTPNMDDPLARRALDYSRTSTWTQELEQGSFSRKVQNFVAQTPATQIVVPFIRTPVNLMHDAFRHIPATSLLYKQVWKDITAKGTEAQAEVLGRWATGSLLFASAMGMAADGLVTGAPPSNPKMRDVWRMKGIRPYSIKIGDTWYEYRRFDPMGFILGMGADAVQIWDEYQRDREDPLKATEVNRALTSVVASIAQGLKDKSYFQGITDFVNAMDDPQRFLSNYANNLATSALPYSGLLRSARRFAPGLKDPLQREVEGIFDAVKNTSPFFSEKLPIKYDWLTGEPIHYTGVITSREKQDAVLTELMRLGETIMGRPERTLKGVELSAEQYSRFCQLNGKVMLYGGKTLHEALTDLVTSPGYAQASDGLPGMENPRAKAINKVIQNYRVAAARLLLEEYPDLADSILRLKVSKRLSRAGAMTKDNQQGLLQQLIQ